ncbi:MAG: hypothetical protein MUF81_17695 [Verrucomicrobia bacterium]|jgi:REP element-mobilizing transposase RayT|nr:hypothetical protein [Verrucomicrobiota bacterium]
MAESNDNARVGRVTSPGVPGVSPRVVGNVLFRDAGLGNPAYKVTRDDVGRVPPRGGRGDITPGAGLGNPADNKPPEPPPQRLRRLHRVWPDRDGYISYLLTLCVESRVRVLDNEATFQRLTAFLLDSPSRYHWFPRRFVVMPDHVYLIAHQGQEAVRLGQWIKALKAVVGGLERRVGSAEERPMGTAECPVGAPGLQHDVPAGRVPSSGGATGHEFTRIKRSWRWQEGFHDHKFRTPESERRKWEYVCLNPVRYGLVTRPEEWAFRAF